VKFLHLRCRARIYPLERAIANARRSAAALVISALCFCAVTARAQTRNADVFDLSPEELRTVQVYTASMYLQSDREAPSSVTIVTADQIRKFGYRTLADLLRGVRGFYVSYDRNYSYVGVRGFSRPGDYNDRILVLIDGHRVNDNVYGQVLIGTEFPLDVALIKRVEIVRGPSSSLYGTNAFLAVVNVITVSADEIGGLQLAGEAGGFGSYKGRSAYGGFAHGVELLLSGTLYESAGASRLFFPAFDSPLTNNGIADNADGDSSRNLFCNLKFGHFALESALSTRKKHIPTASFGTDFNDPRTSTVDSAGYLDLQYNRSLRQDTSLNLRVSYDGAAYHGVYVDPSSVQGSDVLNEDLERGDWLGFNANVTKTFRRKHKVTLGTALQDNLRQNQTSYNLNPRLLILDDHRSSQEWAVFAQDEFTLTKKLILNAGVRHDQYQTFGGTTNPRLALIFTPIKPTTFKLIYGQAFRSPNNYELYYQDGYSVEGNPHLQPESIQSTELVWEQSLSGNFRLSGTAFEDRITNLINQQSDPVNHLLVYENSGKARTRGLGAELAGKTHSGIEGRVSYTFQNSEDLATGLSLTNSPSQLVKANLICPVLNHKLSLGFEAQYTGPRKTLAGTQTAQYTVANITASSREFAGGFRLSATLYNVFNRKYSDPVGQEIAEPALQQNGRDFRIQIMRTFHFH